MKPERNNIPVNPGVYLMKNSGKIIYVGKAKNLQNRVYSYFSGTKSGKTAELVKNIEDIEYIITKSELEALVLENNLIKKHKPKYNIMLKDEKTYPYIKISKERFPKIEIVRSTKRLNLKNGIYFGPYPMGVYKFINVIMKIFKVRDCKRNMERVYERPCLKYYMNKCMGPCVYKEIKSEYNKQVGELIELLKGKDKELVEILKNEMNEYSSNLEYEKAIVVRERINEIKRIASSNIMDSSKGSNEDIFTFKVEGNYIFICVINVIDGKVMGTGYINVDISQNLIEDSFEQILVQYYSKFILPQAIVLDSEYEEKKELLEQWAENEKRKKIKFFFPKIKSRKKELIDIAYINLEKHIEKYFTQKKVVEKGLDILYRELGLKNFPMRMECFDISNIQGKDAVASMSVAIEGKTKSSEYRKYKILIKDTPDDFLMMSEVLYRRYSKLKPQEMPDLILIDGGKGQLSAAAEILAGLDKLKYVDLISIAKKEELIFKEGENEPYVFKRSEEGLKILQRLRDEAHRFGITYHRLLRKKRIEESELDKISGIGPKRKIDLIKHFRSVKRVKEASIDELKEIVPENVAIEIKKLK